VGRGRRGRGRGAVTMEASPAANAALRARLEELLGDYEQLRRGVAAAREQMRTMHGAAATTDGKIKVIVDSRGGLTELELDPRAYRRFSPSQLAAEIIRLAGTARDQVTGQMAEVMAPFLPAGTSYADLLSGAADPASVTPDTPLTNETYDEWRSRFRGQPGPGAR
jgi:YbaB/EbfC DNA-binding family